MSNTIYVIEARNDDGTLRFDGPQPPVRDYTERDLAALAWIGDPTATLHGIDILTWVSDNYNPAWKTRVKTW